MRLSCLLLMVFALACGGSAPELLADARAALADADFEAALTAAGDGLAASPDDVTAWGLELVQLEALARTGSGEEALALLQKLESERPAHVPTSLYSATADQLRVAGQGPVAIQVLDLGMQRFPGDAVLAALIDASAKAPSADGGELDMLRSLGYVE